MDAKQIAEQIGIPLEDWKGNCYSIACKLLDHDIVQGRAVHGTYFGPIADTGYFKAFTRFARHGWIERPDGSIVDPTLWVFLDVEPYIHEGPADPDTYDEGGSLIRKALMSPQPEYDHSDKQCTLPDDLHQSAAIKAVLNTQRNVISMPEAFWLANLPMDMLCTLAKPVYEGLIAMDLKVFIPADHIIKIFSYKSVNEYEQNYN